MTNFFIIVGILVCIVIAVSNNHVLNKLVETMQQANRPQSTDPAVANMLHETAELNRKLMQELLDLKNQVNVLQQKKAQEDANSNIKGMAGNVLLRQMLEDVYGENTKGALWDVERTIDGIGRPDAVVIYGNKMIPIDSKNHKDDYAAYLEGKSDIKNLTATLTKSARNVAKYVDKERGTADAALLFIPSESMYYDVFVKNFDNVHVQNLRRECQKLGVIFCSPNSLYVELTRILEYMRHDAVRNNVEDVIDTISNAQSTIERNISQLDAWETRFKNVLTEVHTLRNVNTKALEKVKGIDADKSLES